MIDYEPGKWQVAFIFRMKGSVFGKALAWAIPSMLVSIFVYKLNFIDKQDKAIGSLFAAYMSVLGFLIVFRSQQAYSRFWEGATMLNETRGIWVDAVSSLFSFCTDREDKMEEVKIFQHLIVRLMSLLFCSVIQDVARMEDEAFDVIDLSGVEPDKIRFLRANPNEKPEVLNHWIMRLVCEALNNKVIDQPPPIVGRVFQLMSQGMSTYHNAQKICMMPFPFPYAQMVTVMLILTTMLTPVIAAVLLESVYFAAAMTFVQVFAYWSINYIAAELELPFGDDANDLPMASYQNELNRFLSILMEADTKEPPTFTPLSREQLDGPLDRFSMRSQALEMTVTATEKAIATMNLDPPQTTPTYQLGSDYTSSVSSSKSILKSEKSLASNGCAADERSSVKVVIVDENACHRTSKQFADTDGLHARHCQDDPLLGTHENTPAASPGSDLVTYCNLAGEEEPTSVGHGATERSPISQSHAEISSASMRLARELASGAGARRSSSELRPVPSVAGAVSPGLEHSHRRVKALEVAPLPLSSGRTSLVVS